MLRIETSNKNGICLVKMTGSISESSKVNFDYLIDGKPAKLIHVDCSGIGRMNSMGVRTWSAWFEKLRGEKVPLRFSNLPVSIISQCNFVLGLINGSEVESLSVPFFCESCTKEFILVKTAEEVRSVEFHPPPEHCPNCQSAADFDGSPLTYFTFMT